MPWLDTDKVSAGCQGGKGIYSSAGVSIKSIFWCIVVIVIASGSF